MKFGTQYKQTVNRAENSTVCLMQPFPKVVTLYIMKYMNIDVTPSMLGLEAKVYKS